MSGVRSSSAIPWCAPPSIATPQPARDGAAHRALADRLGERGHLDRRAWHLAAAATGLDEDLSDELERLAFGLHSAADTAPHRPGYERAADLSPNATDRTRRLAAAADAAWKAGQAARARDLVQRAEQTTDDPVLQAGLMHLRGRAASRDGELDAAYRVLLDGAEMVRDLAPPLALEMLGDAVEAAMYAGDGVRAEHAARRGATIDPGTGTSQRFLFAWLAGTSSTFQGQTSGADWVRTSLSLTDELDDPRLLTWAGIAAVNLGDIGIVQALFRKAVESARTSGAVASLPYPLEKWAMSEALAGNYASARMSAEEGLRLAHETEQLGSACHLQATLALVAGTCGDEVECRRRGRESLDQAVPRGLGLPIANVAWASAGSLSGCGRHESALDHLLSMHGTEPGQGNPVIALWATPDLVEAAVRAGRQAEATDAVERFAAWAAASGQPTAVASVARCRGLLDDRDEMRAAHECGGHLSSGTFTL